MNLCSNQSTCILHLKSFLFFHTQHLINKCRMIKLKSTQLNYSCVTDKFISFNIFNQPKKNVSGVMYTKVTIIVCLCIVVFVSLLAFICSYIENFSIDKEKYSTMNEIQFNTQSIYDNQSKQEYELKILSLIESSSSSSSSTTLTSRYNKNSIKNPSEYDNLTKDTHQLSESPSQLKIKFYENYQLK
ncbi:unnamed protein product [Rotaria socialis]|uniref:Transmembrane protein n=2 Tax=Rotaria socialis TaxID=392032 RepID=A0A817UF39_9BILA|nr:unnamed protein product [Rotaria socialis]CAF3757453.1 unnamed protein product [Rotaria socialis]CAF4538556.1 unnamed protein product [Rotaria socialis]CAF4857507.1 unnamed protein product [Rotaria socialis]